MLHTLLRSRQTGETRRRRRWWQQRQQQRQRQWQSKRQWQWQRPVRMRSASVVVFSLTRPPQTMQPSRLHSVVRVSSRATTSSSSSHFCLCSIANLCRIIAARNVVACGTSKLTLRPEHAATMRRSVCNEWKWKWETKTTENYPKWSFPAARRSDGASAEVETEGWGYRWLRRKQKFNDVTWRRRRRCQQLSNS